MNSSTSAHIINRIEGFNITTESERSSFSSLNAMREMISCVLFSKFPAGDNGCITTEDDPWMDG